ncbi:MAG TPA: leucine-rich repeat domain-containing protein [Paraburkholderia sp.]|uniref:leucine-rich repeat domain-containing protein n=1 Tax=Paraburkholderia sp. TaxID=1926495 RepID=UPI002B49DCDB|nr:leucine-rich repeat domain-containing protein [Paraburkholderia sp.]HKR46740.1 leucine-rich repeat domain-containing protein [Paraburkholderia sp.]
MLDALNRQGVRFVFRRLLERETVSRGLPLHHHVVLILPLLGDNDLTDELCAQLQHWLSTEDQGNRAVYVVAHGDRHASDEFVSHDTPFSAKVGKLFRAVGAFTMFDAKLDRYSAVPLSEEILRAMRAMSAGDIEQLNDIARLMSRRPLWQSDKRMLDFYDQSTGHSLLRSRDRETLRNIAARVSALEPRILKINNAGLGDGVLPDIACALRAQVIDFGSNGFTLDAVARVLGDCRWLGFAANDLTRADLSRLPPGIEHLYVQKNRLCEFAPVTALAARLKSVSVYRNNLASLEWPADQTAIERLNVGANPLARLPETLSNCRSLVSLGLARTAIKRLPDWIFCLAGLRELDISYIEDAIPASQLDKLRQLRVLLITRPGYIVS